MKNSAIDATIQRILASVRTVAVIGLSDNPERPSNDVARFMLDRGYEVVGVNPKIAGRKVDGISVFGNLADIPGPIDMVDIFRRREFLDAEIRAAVALKEQKALRVIWLQLGLSHPEAEAFARGHGFDIVSDRCPKIELQKVQIVL
jgi:predicted CoA-binding protein